MTEMANTVLRELFISIYLWFEGLTRVPPEKSAMTGDAAGARAGF